MMNKTIQKSFENWYVNEWKGSPLNLHMAGRKNQRQYRTIFMRTLYAGFTGGWVERYDKTKEEIK